MIEESSFKVLIEGYFKQHDRVDNLDDLMPGVAASEVIDYGFKMFDELINVYFNEFGIDWIYYYLYENLEKCYYENGERKPLETLDDLWNLIKEYRK